MAAEYFLYNTFYSNTLVDRSNTSFAPLPPYDEIFIEYFIPEIQPLYLYRETGNTIVLNDESTINSYLEGTSTTEANDIVIQDNFTGYTASTEIKIDTKHNILDFNSFTGTTLPTDYYNKSQINIYTGVTDQRLDTHAFNIVDNANDIVSLENNKVNRSGDTITGLLNGTSISLSAGLDVTGTIQGTDAQLSGNLTVNGSMNVRHIEQIYTRGDFVFMRSGATGGLGIGEISGFGVLDADGSGTTVIMGTDMNGVMRVGWSGDTLQALATREDNPIDNGISFWSETEQMFVTSGYTMDNLTTDIASKIPKVPAAETGHIAIFNGDGTIIDGGVSIDEITGGTGYYFYTDRTATQSTTSLTNVIYLIGDSETLTAGTWSIDFNAIGGNISPNKAVIVEFYIDNVLQGYPNRFKTNDGNATMSFVVSKDLTLTNTIHTFEIRFRQAQGGTAYLEYGSIRARIVN